MCLTIKHNEKYLDKFLIDIPEKMFNKKEKSYRKSRFYAVKKFRTDAEGKLLSWYIQVGDYKYYQYKITNGTLIRESITEQEVLLNIGVRGALRVTNFTLTTIPLGFHASLGDEKDFERALDNTLIYRTRPKKHLPAELLLLIRFWEDDLQIFDGAETIVIKKFYIPKRNELEKVREFFNKEIKKGA